MGEINYAASAECTVETLSLAHAHHKSSRKAHGLLLYVITTICQISYLFAVRLQSSRSPFITSYQITLDSLTGNKSQMPTALEHTGLFINKQEWLEQVYGHTAVPCFDLGSQLKPR